MSCPDIDRDVLQAFCLAKIEWLKARLCPVKDKTRVADNQDGEEKQDF